MAFGNPLGLESSVTLGVVSSVARQLKPEDNVVYMQTDASEVRIYNQLVKEKVNLEVQRDGKKLSFSVPVVGAKTSRCASRTLWIRLRTWWQDWEFW